MSSFKLWLINTAHFRYGPGAVPWTIEHTYPEAVFGPVDRRPFD